MSKNNIIPLDEGGLAAYGRYLSDESRRVGTAESIAFPENADETGELLSQMRRSGTSVTVQGARTGLSGKAVPAGGLILSLVNMNGCGEPFEREGELFLPVEAGVTLSEIEERLRGKSLFWPAATTEPSATVGGVIAGAARGIFASRYGEAADWCGELEYAGEVLLSAALRLMPLPAAIWGIAFFFGDFESAAKFVLETAAMQDSAIAALEFQNDVTLECISELRKNSARLQGLADTAGQAAMVYVELHADSEERAEDTAAALMELSESCGGDAESSWALSGRGEVERIRLICHAAQEAALAAHDSALGGEALGFEPVVEGESGIGKLRLCMAQLREKGLRACIFGSLTGGRLRICPIAESEDGRAAAIELIDGWRAEIRGSGR